MGKFFMSNKLNIALTIMIYEHRPFKITSACLSHQKIFHCTSKFQIKRSYCHRICSLAHLLNIMHFKDWAFQIVQLLTAPTFIFFYCPFIYLWRKWRYPYTQYLPRLSHNPLLCSSSVHMNSDSGAIYQRSSPFPPRSCLRVWDGGAGGVCVCGRGGSRVYLI